MLVESTVKVLDVNDIITLKLKEEPQLIKDYKLLSKKIRDEYKIKITDEELDEYFEPNMESESSTLRAYYQLLNMNY